MENVTQVQEQLAAMGYQVNSQMDFLESSRQQSNMVQAVLGGIGAVSLCSRHRYCQYHDDVDL